jgi:biotin carboxyl carrier protein
MNDFVVSSNKNKYNVSINESRVIIDDNEFTTNLTQLSNHLYLLKINDKVFQITSQKISSEEYSLSIDGFSFETTVRTKLEEEANTYLMNKAKEGGSQVVKSPMPGLIVKILKKVGDSVEMGEAVILLEAMKMENEVRSTTSGVVEQINIKENQSVEKNTPLIVIA